MPPSCVTLLSFVRELTWQPLGWLSQATLTYIAGHLSGATLSMTTYTGVSTPLGFHFLGDHDELINKLVHATALQWGLYGTLPSVITFAGMITIVGTGMYSTVSSVFPLLRLGPADTPLDVRTSGQGGPSHRPRYGSSSGSAERR